MQAVRVLKSAAQATLEALSTHKPAHREALAVAQLEEDHEPVFVPPAQRHLDAGIGWIKRAQDSSGSDGVAWGYRARRPVHTDYPLGWIPAYPETTGYIIPTMLRYADLTGDHDSIERVQRMIAWERKIQLADGGIQGGIYGDQPVASSTFVTGQVLFGMVAAYRRFREEATRVSAVKAGQFLLSCLDGTGRFAKGFSLHCAPGPKAYEVRTALALAELGDVLDEKVYRTAASRIADYALSTQRTNGWFGENDLEHYDKPLTHTIGYAMEGLHGIGIQLNRSECISAVERTLDNILPLIRDDGFLAGRWRHDWTPAVAWSCLTGSSQIAGVFLRMYRQTGKRAYFEAGLKLLGFVCFTQDLSPGFVGIDGGIRGAYPFGGGYSQWCVLNWATKFFADSMMDYAATTELKRAAAAAAS